MDHQDENDRGRTREPSDQGAAAEEIQEEICRKEIIRQIPWRVILNNLSDEEKLLFRLIYLEGMSPSEIADYLGSQDRKRVARAVNKLRNKVRQRIKRLLLGSSQAAVRRLAA